MKKKKSIVGAELQRNRCNADLSDLIPIKIPELKNMTVYMKPGGDPDKIREYYLNRYNYKTAFKK